jgi:hypothetical protein
MPKTVVFGGCTSAAEVKSKLPSNKVTGMQLVEEHNSKIAGMQLVSTAQELACFE